MTIRPLLLRTSGETDETHLGGVWPYSCLTITDVSSGSQCRHLMRKYKLTSMASAFSNTAHLYCPLMREGDHKLQAIRLFFLSLELARYRIAGRMLLHLVSRLHVQLATQTGQDAACFTPDGTVRIGFSSESTLSVEPSISLVLIQADIIAPPDELRLHFSTEELIGLWERLAHPSQYSSVGETFGGPLHRIAEFSGCR